MTFLPKEFMVCFYPFKIFRISVLLFSWILFTLGTNYKCNIHQVPNTHRTNLICEKHTQKGYIKNYKSIHSYWSLNLKLHLSFKWQKKINFKWSNKSQIIYVWLLNFQRKRCLDPIPPSATNFIHSSLSLFIVCVSGRRTKWLKARLSI